MREAGVGRAGIKGLPIGTQESLCYLGFIAKRRHISINKLMEELSTQAIAEFDADTRFRAMAAKGNVEKGLAILDKLDDSFQA